MSTLKEIIQRALGGEESKVASYEAADDYVYDYADDYTEKLASSLEYLALNLHAIELPVEQKVAEFQEFLTKMAEDAAVAQGAMEDAIDPTVMPNDYGVDITGGEIAPRPVAQSRVVLPMNTPIGAVHDMSPTSIPVDEDAPGIIPLDEQSKVAGVLRVFELLKVASAVDNPPNIVGERVEDPGLLLYSPDGLGTPAGGPFAIPEIQSNESAIQASGRDLVRRNNAGILNYISESGEDPTEDLLLDNAKTASLVRILEILPDVEKHAGFLSALKAAPTGARAARAGLVNTAVSASGKAEIASARGMLQNARTRLRAPQAPATNPFRPARLPPNP